MAQASALLFVSASFILTALTIANAFVQKKQFFPAVVYITKSSPSVAVMYIQGLVAAYVSFQLARKLFFGQLRAAETEHLTERTWHAIMETCLAFTVFREDFSPRFVMLFVLLLFIKSFHWLSEDRVDFMERSPVITLLFHVRMISLLAFLSMLDSYFVSDAYFTTLLKGASVQIVFGFEYAILMTTVLHVSIKYILHMHDLRRVHPWENKAVYLLYSELIINLLRCFLYVIFVAVMIRLHTFPLFSIRPLYLSIRAFHKAITDVILSRRAIHAMNNLFPLATEEELIHGDNTCIICREEMTVMSGPKKLPCNHIFHSNCLRSWFQRQQSCPTCRTDILAQRRPAPAAAAPPPRAEPAPAQPAFGPIPAPGPGAGEVPPNMFPFIAHHFGFPPPAPQQQQQQQNGAENGSIQSGGQQGTPETSASAGSSTNVEASASGVQTAGATSFPAGTLSQMPWPPIGFPTMQTPQNPFMMMSPPIPFLFPTPPSFNGLSDAEVAAMEGRERSAIEARITCLRNVGVLLDAAVVQLQQYSSVVQALSLQQPNSEFKTMQQSASGTSEMPSTSTADLPSTSEVSRSVPDTSRKEESSETSELQMSSSNIPASSSNTDMSKLRQRRLQKFVDRVEQPDRQEAGSRSSEELDHSSNHESS